MNFCARMSPTVKPVKDVMAFTNRGLEAKALLYAAHTPAIVALLLVYYETDT